MADQGLHLLRLNPFVAARYAPLTFTAYRPLLESFVYDDRILAIGAALSGDPVGLALALRAPNRTAKILSIYVRQAFRRRGIGIALLRQIEHALKEEGHEAVVGFRAIARADRDDAVERFLATTGWPLTGNRLHHITTDCRIRFCGWFDRAVVAAPFEIASWNSVTAAERSMLARGADAAAWIPAALNPIGADAYFLPETSLVLRHHGDVVGWAITEALPPDIIRYVTVFVKPSVNRAGRTFATLAVIAEAVRRQAHVWGPLSRGRFEVQPSNTGFLRFIERHLAGYVLERVENERLVKRLTPSNGRESCSSM